MLIGSVLGNMRLFVYVLAQPSIFGETVYFVIAFWLAHSANGSKLYSPLIKRACQQWHGLIYS